MNDIKVGRKRNETKATKRTEENTEELKTSHINMAL